MRFFLFKKIALKSLYITGDIKGGKALKSFIESGCLFTESLDFHLISILDVLCIQNCSTLFRHLSLK